jgi:hypothetical protein
MSLTWEHIHRLLVNFDEILDVIRDFIDKEVELTMAQRNELIQDINYMKELMSAFDNKCSVNTRQQEQTDQVIADFRRLATYFGKI